MSYSTKNAYGIFLRHTFGFWHQSVRFNCRNDAVKRVVSESAPNLAHHKYTTQSSTFNETKSNSSSAVDGKRDPNFNHSSCSGTLRSANPWWQVDLAGSYEVQEIIITNRGYCSMCGKLYRNVLVKIRFITLFQFAHYCVSAPLSCSVSTALY